MLNLAAILMTALIAQATPVAPTAATGSASAVTTSSATVAGTVNPGGAATTFHVEYGTSTSYGLVTSDQDAGSGTADAAVNASLDRLTSDTTYHYRVVATNAAGVARGDDKTLRTAAGPRPPTVSSSPATGVSAAGATLVARVSPRGVNTSVHFEYGTSASYGVSTPEVGIGASAGTVTASAPIAGLKANTRYHFRAVATNAAGVTRGGDRSFVTGRAPTGVSTTFSGVRPVWGSGVTVTGKVSGVGSTPVALEKQDFPYTGAFVQVATATANSSGNFSMTSPALGTTTRMRVVTRTAVVAASAPVTVSVAIKVGLKTHRLTGKRVQLTGTLWPAVPQGRVSLQRQSSTGHWNPVARTTPTALSGGRSHYRFTVRRHARALAYRVVVLARDGGAHVPGTSRVVTLPRR